MNFLGVEPYFLANAASLAVEAITKLRQLIVGSAKRSRKMRPVCRMGQRERNRPADVRECRRANRRVCEERVDPSINPTKARPIRLSADLSVTIGNQTLGILQYRK